MRSLPAAADDGSILLAAAAEQGTFNVGAAHAVATRVTDPASRRRYPQAGLHDSAGHFRGNLRKSVSRCPPRGSDRRRAAGGQGREARTGSPDHRGDRDQGYSGSPANPPGDPVRLEPGRADHRLAGDRHLEGSRPPGQQRRQSRARDGHDPDRRPVRAASRAPEARACRPGYDSPACCWQACWWRC